VFYHDLLITKLHHIGYKIILMAYIVQKICFMASRISNYLNKIWGWSNDKPPCQKVSSISPPCHTKVTLLMAEFCDPTSASDKHLCLFVRFHENICWSNLPKIAHLSALKLCPWNVTVSQKTTNCAMIMVKILSVYCKYILLIWQKKWEGSVHSSYLNVRNVWFTLHNVASTDLHLNQKSGEKQRNVLNAYNLSDHQFKDSWRSFGA